MSTKIYSGFRMTARDLRQVLDDLNPVLKRASAALVEREATFLANIAVGLLDKAALAGLPGFAQVQPITSLLTEARNQLWERQGKVRQTQRRDPAVDYEVFFRLWLCRKTSAYIGYVVGEHASDAHTVLIKSKKAADYSYWNNTDGPEDLNARQWKKRADIWHALLRGDSGPWFDIRVPDSAYCEKDRILAAIPSYESRVEAHSQSIACSEWFKTQKQLANIDDSLEAYLDFRSLLREGDAAIIDMVKDARARVIERLVPDITEKHLLGI